jgi:hypothetical protein
VAHARKAIRAAVVAALLTPPTSAGARVYPTRVVPYKEGELPAIAVYTLTEDLGEDDAAPSQTTRQLDLVVEGWVAQSDDAAIDDDIDDLATEIEAAIEAASTTTEILGGLASELELVRTEMAVNRDGRQLMGIVILTYAVTYQASFEDPEETDLFLRVQATHRLEGVYVDDPDAPVVDEAAIDEFTVQEEP